MDDERERMKLPIRLVAVAALIAGTASHASASHCPRSTPPPKGEQEVATPQGLGLQLRLGVDGLRAYGGAHSGDSYLYADGSRDGARMYGHYAGNEPWVAPHNVLAEAGRERTAACAHTP